MREYERRWNKNTVFSFSFNLNSGIRALSNEANLKPFIQYGILILRLTSHSVNRFSKALYCINSVPLNLEKEKKIDARICTVFVDKLKTNKPIPRYSFPFPPL